MGIQKKEESDELGNLLLLAGITLLKAGAGSHRIVLNLTRIALAYGYEISMHLGTRNISISLNYKNQLNIFSGSRSVSSLPGVNFKVITAISQLSWSVSEKNMSLAETGTELKNAMQLPEYKRYIILLFTGLAGSAFCFTFGGNTVEMGITFIATLAGLFLKQEMNKKKFNPYIVTYCSAFLAAFIIGVLWKSGVESKLDDAFATAVLFLIPGVPLINSLTDLMDGYIINGLDRGINALMHAFSIAAGLATILHIFNVQ